MKLLVVTGATSGIGKQIAQQATLEGYQVIGLARRSPAENLPFPIQTVDVSDPDQVAVFFRSLKAESLWGVINAAGIASMNLAITTPQTTMMKIISTNLLGTIYCCTESSKKFIRNKGGRIINFSTIAVPLALVGESIYAASKAGVETFSRCFAREMSGFGVTVNTVAPGPVDTPLLAGVSEEKIETIVQAQVIQRRAEGLDIWNIVSFLLSEKSSMLSGQVLHVGGV